MQPDHSLRSGARVWSLLVMALLIMNAIIMVPTTSTGGPLGGKSERSSQEGTIETRAGAHNAHVEVFADPEKFVIKTEGIYSIDFIFEEYCGSDAEISSIDAKILNPFGEMVLDLPDRHLSAVEVPGASSTVYEYKFFIKGQKIIDLRARGLTRLELEAKFTGYSLYGGSFEIEITMPAELESRIALIVNSDIYNGIKDNLDRYQEDIKSKFSAMFFVHQGRWSTPESLRNLLIDEWEDNDITGAILIGDMPYAEWELIHDTYREPCPIPIFYEDLDGTFADNDSNGRYDRHYWGENDGPEIWVSNWFMPMKTIPSNNLGPWGTGVTGGLLGHYYNDTGMTDLIGTRVDPVLDINFNESLLPAGMETGKFSAKWTGSLIVNNTENIDIVMELEGGATLSIDNTLLINHWGASVNVFNTFRVTKYLTKGLHDIVIEYYKWDETSTKNGSLFIGWESQQVNIDNYNDYLEKTHLYHTGKLGQPEKGLLFMDYPYGYQCKMLEPLRDFHLYPLYGENLVVGGGRNETNAWEYLEYLEPGYELLSIWSHASGRAHQFQPPKNSSYPYTGARFSDIRGMNGATITLMWSCHGADFGETEYWLSSSIDQNLAINYAFNTKYGLVSAGCTRSFGTTFRETYHTLKNRSTVGDGYLGYKDYSYNRTLRVQQNQATGLDRWIDDEALFGDPFVTSDHIPGDLSLTINDGRKFVNDTQVLLHLYSNNPGEMSLRNEGGEWTQWIPFADEIEWNLSIQQGYGKVHFRMRNIFGECWYEASAAVGYDTTPPGPVYVKINDGAPMTNRTTATLNIVANDDLSGPVKMRLSNDRISWALWRNFSNNINWDLGSGDGRKEVFMEVKDRAGLVSNIASASIILDTIVPSTEVEIQGEMGNNGWFTSGVEIFLSTPEEETADIKYQRDLGPTESYSSPIFFYSSGHHELRFWSEDQAGNVETSTYMEFFLDRDDPKCLDLRINDGALFTNSRSVSLQIEAFDQTSGCFEICVCSDGSNWGEWLVFSELMTYELEGEDGPNIVEVRIRDEAGNEVEQIMNASIILDTTPPDAINPSPYPDQTNVSLDSWIVVRFDEEVHFDPEDGAVIMVYDSRYQVVKGEVDFWNGSMIASFEPEEPLKPFERYKVVINPGLTDRSGNQMASDYFYHFNTIGIPPPGLNDINAILDDVNVSLFWSEPENDLNIPIDGYRVYRSIGENEDLIFEGAADSTSTIDRYLEPGSTYLYSVASFNEYGESPRSPDVMIEVPEVKNEDPPPEEPVDVPDDDEEPAVEEKEKENSTPLIILTILVAISILLAVMAGVYLFMKRRDTSAEADYLGADEE